MKIEPYRPEHLTKLALQPDQQAARVFISEPGYPEMLASTNAFTAIIDGRIVGCAGIMELWKGRGMAWALLTGEIGGENMRRIHFAVKRYLDASTFQRIEATCDVNFAQGHRWLRLLGFTMETPVMRRYRPDGGDEAMYVRIR